MSLMTRPRADLDWPDWFPRRFFDWPEAFREMMDESSIRVEEIHEGDMLVVRAELPGIDPDKDVEITISDNMLHISAERREENKTEDAKGYRSEFRYGSFMRSVALPPGSTDADVTATYTDGILEVRFPIRTEEQTTKKIPIERT
jgi:HSP20 family protein